MLQVIHLELVDALNGAALSSNVRRLRAKCNVVKQSRDFLWVAKDHLVFPSMLIAVYNSYLYCVTSGPLE